MVILCLLFTHILLNALCRKFLNLSGRANLRAVDPSDYSRVCFHTYFYQSNSIPTKTHIDNMDVSGAPSCDVVIEEINNEDDDEGNLIQKFVHGEADFPDFYSKLEPHEQPDGEEAEEDDD
ncbi:uncharacterized protein [Musca autumnalis]|uniref:uncharacterized protein n=1 Tax=Musca autumnalis TaxID=221902 RepID=UPI003CED4961